MGLSQAAIDAAWPHWWSVEAAGSTSANLELHFSVARKLGLDPQSLVDASRRPEFRTLEHARFKNLTSETDEERAAISSFGIAVATLLIPGVPVGPFREFDVRQARVSLLKQHQFVGLLELLELCWAIGVPVVHLRVLPREQKRMAAMAVSIGGRGAILLARDSVYAPKIAFYLAHELGHLVLGHLGIESAIVDLGSEPGERKGENDVEELAADRFALELLTGSGNTEILPSQGHYNAPGLASAALAAAEELRIEPGTLALCLGYSTSNWALVNSAMQFIYGPGQPVWRIVNQVAASQLQISEIPEDARPFIESVLGFPSK